MLPLIVVAATLASPPACQEISLPETAHWDGHSYPLAEGVQLRFGHDESLNSDADDGQRAMLFKTEGGATKRMYYSSGARDSSAMRPSFFSHCGPHQLLILAEISNEYSWGFRVFAFDGTTLRDLGEIPIAATGEHGPESAIPSVKLTPHDSVVSLTFSLASVYKHPGERSEQKLAGKDVRYQIGATSIAEK